MTRALTMVAVVLFSSVGAAQEAPITAEINVIARDVAQSWYERALVAERDRRTLDAEGMFQRAVEADAGLLGAHLGYARMLDARGHRADAVAVLMRAPRRAWAGEREAMEYARALQGAGALEEALSALRERRESVDATRLLVEMASQGGRFPEALAAARRLSEIPSAGDGDARQAGVLVRALTRLVAEADAVRAPHTSTAFRRVLMRDR